MMEEIRYRGVIKKQDSEKRPASMDYADRMPTGATLVSATVSGWNIYANVLENTILSSTTATISGTTASVFVLGGTSGQRYKVTFTATLSDTSILEDDVLMIVENL